ncbi:hypothetical protein CISG_09462 [Coccidioides immitis RMSCC 3703]|nr:hypothetical protein CISG_09462 [Coccidioides immitis RMSCC 3703]
MPHKPKAKGRYENSNSFPVSDHKEKQGDHYRKSNGGHHLHSNANGHHSTSNGWQTTKRRNKKGPKLSAEQNDGTARPEPIPIDESERKGG